MPVFPNRVHIRSSLRRTTRHWSTRHATPAPLSPAPGPRARGHPKTANHEGTKTRRRHEGYCDARGVIATEFRRNGFIVGSVAKPTSLLEATSQMFSRQGCGGRRRAALERSPPKELSRQNFVAMIPRRDGTLAASVPSCLRGVQSSVCFARRGGLHARSLQKPGARPSAQPTTPRAAASVSPSR